MQSNNQIWRITFLYFAFGFTWIFFTDKLLHLFVPDLEVMLQTYKGWVYILGTTLMLFLLLKASQKKLVISNRKIELKDRVIARTEEEKRELKQLTDELKEANEELQTFNYSVSHDLKAPLRVIQGYTEILHRKYEGKITEEDIRLLSHIKNSVTHINELINNLLSFAATGRASMVPERLDVNALFVNAVAECRQVYKEVDFKVDIYALPVTMGDKTLLYQVVSNLVSNAFKYSSKNNSPIIEIGAVIDGKNNTYYVKDNGTGFDTQFSKDLFKPFKRWHSKSEYEGNGVGLAIAERVISKHKGKIWAESTVGKGSTFYFSLPISAN